MRLRWTWLIGFLLLAALLFIGAAEMLGWRGGERFPLRATQQDAPGWQLTKVPDALVSMAYLTDKDQWLVFDLPPEQTVLRIMSNADLPLAERAKLPRPVPEETQWHYALQYQLLDRSGQVLAQRDHHHQTRLTEFFDAGANETITGVFYLGDEVIPADGRNTLINLNGLRAPVAKLRLRLLAVDAPLTGVAVRVYRRYGVAEHKLRYVWQRTMADRQRRLARGNVYSTNLLNEQEQQNLLLQRWAALAPQGVEGRDYRQRELYVLKNVEGEQVREHPFPAGILADRDRRAVIPIPEGGGRVRLVFQPLLPPLTLPSPPSEGGEGRVRGGGEAEGSIELHWYGRKLSERSVTHVPWRGRERGCELSLGGGVLEVQASDALAVRAFLVDGDTEITPELIYTWTYLLQGDAPVEFEVLPTGGVPTPYRIDLRLFQPVASSVIRGPASRTLVPAKVRYDMLDSNHQTVKQGELVADKPSSAYDSLLLVRQEAPVSDPSTCFLAVPASVVRLRFLPVDAPVVVAVANRPGQLVKTTCVPEDYFSFNRDELTQKSWFPVRALGHNRLLLDNRVPTLWLQPRPQEDDPDILAGRYQWEDYLPGGSWRARHLLVPRDPDLVWGPQAMMATYRELTPSPSPLPLRGGEGRVRGHETELLFQAQPGRQEIPLGLLWLTNEPGPLSLKVVVDGRLHYQTTVEGTRGEVLLPPLSLQAGNNRSLCVTASRPAQVFLNYVDPGKAPALVKRLAIQLDEAALVFEYEKVSPGDELLSLTLFAPEGTTERTRLRARIESAAAAALGPHASWTFRERVYDLRPAEGQAVPVLGTDEENVDQGQVCFFPMGSDLPPGRYRFRLEWEDGPGGYVILARTAPGLYERRDFFIEHPSAARTSQEKKP